MYLQSFSIIFELPQLVHRAFIRDGRRIYRLLPQSLRRRCWLLFIVQFISALTEVFALLVISLFAISVAAPEAALSNFIVRAILALSPSLAAWCSEPRHLVGFTSLLMAVFIFAKVFFAALVAHKTSFFAENVSLHIGRETLRRYLNKSYFWHISAESSRVLHKFAQRSNLSQFLVSLLLLCSNALCAVTLFVSLFLAEPLLTIFVLAVFSLGSLAIYRGLRKRLDQAGQTVNNLSIAESAERMALSHGLREILIYRRQDIFFQKMTATMTAKQAPQAFLAFSGVLPSQGLELLGFITIAFVSVTLLAWGVVMPAIVSAVSMLMLTAWRVLPSVSRCLGYTVTLRGLRPAALTCLELLETFVAQAVEPLPAPDHDFRFKRDITLRDISFTYPDALETALANLSLTVQRGERVGLIGPSGAGKSTLALLLAGLVTPQEGIFLIDGHELTPAGRAAYLRLVGFVPQSPLLLPGTVIDNVAFSRWGENYDRDWAAEACRLAAVDFLHIQGLERPINEGGQGLSGGQAQRVAIARVFFAKPEIIIFDEATSALDQANENIINDAVRKLKPGTTAIIIAHRLTTVADCDRLIWLESGRVKAAGPPAEILPRYEAAILKGKKESKDRPT